MAPTTAFVFAPTSTSTLASTSTSLTASQAATNISEATSFTPPTPAVNTASKVMLIMLGVVLALGLLGYIAWILVRRQRIKTLVRNDETLLEQQVELAAIKQELQTTRGLRHLHLSEQYRDTCQDLRANTARLSKSLDKPLHPESPPRSLQARQERMQRALHRRMPVRPWSSHMVPKAHRPPGGGDGDYLMDIPVDDSADVNVPSTPNRWGAGLEEGEIEAIMEGMGARIIEEEFEDVVL